MNMTRKGQVPYCTQYTLFILFPALQLDNRQLVEVAHFTSFDIWAFTEQNLNISLLSILVMDEEALQQSIYTLFGFQLVDIKLCIFTFHIYFCSLPSFPPAKCNFQVCRKSKPQLSIYPDILSHKHTKECICMYLTFYLGMLLYFVVWQLHVHWTCQY